MIRNLKIFTALGFISIKDINKKTQKMFLWKALFHESNFKFHDHNNVLYSSISPTL
jgi:hypothetical protein